jgi:hypothetical protein
MRYPSGCLLCGEPLVYHSQAIVQTCAYCGGSFESAASCSQGHFVCDACHGADASDLIEQYCLQAQSNNPLEMAITLMSHPSVAMHGPEHHFLVPAVLLAAYHQLEPDADLAVQLKQARKRAEGVKGGSCGFCGNCGAAVGTGIFISLVTGSTPLAKKGWQLSNRMTAESLLAIAEHGGPRCCKRDTYLALQTAQAFLCHQLDAELEMTAPIRCDFSHLNKECLLMECPFYPGRN